MKTCARSVLVLLCSLLLLVTISSHAGDAPPTCEPLERSNVRLSFGIGMGGNGLALGLSYSYLPIVGSVFGIVRAVIGCRFDMVEPAEASPQVELRGATEVGILFGKEIERPKWHAHAAAGVGWTWAAERTRLSVEPHAARSEDFSALSVPIEVGFFLSPVLPVGLGLTGFGNLNSEKSYIGLLLCLELRRFEPPLE